jgi:hypothetical protein
MEVRKFIIIDNELILGCVSYHSHLIPKSFREKGENPIGGGRWEWNDKDYPRKIFFFGSSFDFGRVTEQQLKDAWENSLISPAIENCEIIFSEKEFFSDVLKEKGL